MVEVGGFRRYPGPLFRITNRGYLVDVVGESWRHSHLPHHAFQSDKVAHVPQVYQGMWRELSFRQLLVSGQLCFTSTAAAPKGEWKICLLLFCSPDRLQLAHEKEKNHRFSILSTFTRSFPCLIV